MLKTAKALIVMNVQHSIMPDQARILDAEFGQDGWQLLKVPAAGWDLGQIKEELKKVPRGAVLVFASPIPAMITLRGRKKLAVMHNDLRDKKELSDGKIIMVVAQTGWQLIKNYK